MEIKASQVKELRDMTGVAMMDCKKALVESNGDIEKAVDLLRSNSALKAEKKSSRVAADGVLVLSMGDGYASMVELNSETDFASKDSNFLAFGEKVKNYISENKITEPLAFLNFYCFFFNKLVNSSRRNHFFNIKQSSYRPPYCFPIC